MGNGLVRIVAVALFLGACDAPSVEDIAEQGAAVTTSEVAGSFSIEAPPGDYNAFNLDAPCSTYDWAWTRSNYVIDPNLDCLDCFLPSSIVIGAPIAAHEISACLPSDAHTGCESTTDVSQLAIGDLLKPATLENGEQLPVDRIDITFRRVYEAWDDSIADSYGVTRPFPRIDHASAILNVSSDGVVSVGSDWSFCEDALNTDDCF